MLNLKVSGLSQVTNKLNRLGKGMPGVIEDATRDAGDYVMENIPGYPPEPNGSRYRRTGNLGYSFFATLRSPGNIGIGSYLDYAAWVISSKRVGGAGPQAWMHRGRWWTLQGVLDTLREGILEIYRAKIDELKGD